MEFLHCWGIEGFYPFCEIYSKFLCLPLDTVIRQWRIKHSFVLVLMLLRVIWSTLNTRDNTCISLVNQSSLVDDHLHQRFISTLFFLKAKLVYNCGWSFHTFIQVSSNHLFKHCMMIPKQLWTQFRGRWNSKIIIKNSLIQFELYVDFFGFLKITFYYMILLSYSLDLWKFHSQNDKAWCD